MGNSVDAISKVTGYTRDTTKRHLGPNYSPVYGQYGVSHPGKLSPYRQEIKRLRSQNVTYQDIYDSIKEKGYTRSVSALRGFMTKEKRLDNDFQSSSTQETEVVEKKWLIKLLYKLLMRYVLLAVNSLMQ